MKKTMTMAGLVVAGVAACIGAAEEKPAAATKQGSAAAGLISPDANAIRMTGESFARAFNAGDAKAVAALWAVDGEYVGEDGSVVAGREAIEKEYAGLFSAHPGIQIRIAIDSIRLVSPDLAIEDGAATVIPASGWGLTASRYTAVHLKRDDQWLVTSVRDWSSTPLSNYVHLADLESIIGTWVAESGTHRVHTTCEWALNRNFIKRSYSVHEADQVVSTGMEMIGWDPSIGQVRSWTFDSGGGHGQSLWTRDEDRWIIETIGTHVDGSETTATNVIARVDKDVLTWQSSDRAVAGEALPDIEPVRITRAKSGKTPIR